MNLASISDYRREGTVARPKVSEGETITKSIVVWTRHDEYLAQRVQDGAASESEVVREAIDALIEADEQISKVYA